MTKIEPARTFRVQVILTSEEMAAIDEFRFERRMPNKAAAVRELIRRGMTADQYKCRFGYNRRRPLMCHWLLRFYAARAVRNGLALRIRRRPIVAEPELRRRGGSRPVALEELLTRRDARRTNGRGSP